VQGQPLGVDVLARGCEVVRMVMNAVLRKKAKKKIPLYGDEEREHLRLASRFNAELTDLVRATIRPGVTTLELDRLVYEYTTDHGHVPATLGYKGFPRSICTSVNEVVCHGIPDHTPLQEGDIVNVDLTTIVHGWYGDQSETFCVGRINEDARRVVQVAFDALHAGIQAAQPFSRVCDIGRAIERFVKARGFEVVREYQGHGIALLPQGGRFARDSRTRDVFHDRADDQRRELADVCRQPRWLDGADARPGLISPV
jgi:methionyl aminopeptidase